MSTDQVIQSLLAASFVSLLSLSGIVFYFLSADRLKLILPYIVSMAVGILLGNSFLHLIPDAMEEIGSVEEVSILTMVGILLFFFIEKVLQGNKQPEAYSLEASTADFLVIKPLGKMNIVGDSVHNFTDGALIAISFAISPELGLVTTIAIAAHEIPQEIADTGALMYSGYSLKRSLTLNFFSSLPSLVGVLFIVLLQGVFPFSMQYLLPVIAGGFIYIAASDMMPELQRKFSSGSTVVQCLSIAFGILFMLITARLENLFAAF